MNTILITALAATAVALTACVSVLPDPLPAPSIYRLSASDQVVTPAQSAKVVRIDRPASSNFYETNSIVVSPDGRRLATASGAKWSEAIPTLVQEALVTRMAASPKIIGVIPSSGARTQTRIHLTIKNFEAQFDQGEGTAPLAIVRYDLTMSDASDRALLGTYSTRKTARASAASVSSIVEAMEQANKAAMDDIVVWLEEDADKIN